LLKAIWKVLSTASLSFSSRTSQATLSHADERLGLACTSKEPVNVTTTDNHTADEEDL